MNSAMQFLKEVRLELAKVEWPSIDETIGATLVVLVVVVFFAIFLFFVDHGVAWSIKRVFEHVFPRGW
jgi:preprotein translocase subunit SecE